MMWLNALIEVYVGVWSAPVPPTGWLPTGSAQSLTAPGRTGPIHARQGREQEREGRGGGVRWGVPSGSG